MRNLRRLATSLVALVLVLAFSSCEKQPAADAQGEVSFNINNVTDNLKKGIIIGDKPTDAINIPDCSNLDAAYVVINIDGTDHTLNVLALEDGTQTVVMKLDAPATHTINSFMVYAIDNTLIWAAPMASSPYAINWSLVGLATDFDVTAFTKTKINVDVLCWEPYSYTEFGFNWFDYQEVTIKNLCFFGDVCTKFYDSFYNTVGSPYYKAGGSDKYDMPAIFEVIIRNKATGKVLNDLTMNSNASWQGEGDPLCIEYPDFGDIDNEALTFEIHLAYPDGTYNLIHSQDFMAEDMQSTITGDDGIFDFVVGNCSADGNSTNIELPPYLYIPEHGRILVDPVQHDGLTHYEYFDVTLLGASWTNTLFPEEFAEGNILGAYCGDLYSLISSAHRQYDVDLYSSLKPDDMPTLYDGYKWYALNWLANQDHAITESQLDGQMLQAIVWFIIHTDQGQDSNGDTHTAAQLFSKIQSSTGLSSANTTLAKGIAVNALTKTTFVPETGQYSIVIMDPVETYEADGTTCTNCVGTENIQLVIVRVDP